MLKVSKNAKCLLLVFILYVTGLTAQENFPDGGDLSYGEIEKASFMNPYEGVKALAVTDHLFSMIYEPLIKYDFDSNKIVPVLAESWDEARDNKSIIFYLRKNVTWHDGEPFTAQDVLFTFEFIRLKARPEIQQRFNFIKEKKVIDDFTISFTFDRAIPDVLDLLVAWIIPEHRFTDELLDKQDTIGALKNFPIGTGPYNFVKQTIDNNISLRVNNNYWTQRGHISAVRMLNVPDPALMIDKLLMGGMKLAIETPLNQYARVKDSGKYNTFSYASLQIHAFAYNFNNDILKDDRVRQALTYATNRQHLLDEWYAGKGDVLFGPIVKANPYYNLNLTPREYNIEKAKELLDAAGYLDIDGNGFRQRQTDQKPLRFYLLYPVPKVASSTEIQNVVESYSNYMKEIGVKIIQQPLDINKYLETVFNEHEFDIAWIEWTFNTGYNITDLFYSKNNGPNENNFISYNNSAVDSLIQDFNNASDKEKRRACMNDMQEILFTECPYTFLYSLENIASIHNSIYNVKIDPYFFFTFLPQWYIPEEFQF